MRLTVRLPLITMRLLATFSALLISVSLVAALEDPRARTLLVTHAAPSRDSAECLRSTYMGAYGGSRGKQDHIYLPNLDCVETTGLAGMDEGSLIPLDAIQGIDDGRIIWVGQAGVHPDLRAVSNTEDAWKTIRLRARSSMGPTSPDGAQKTFDSLSHPQPVQLLHQSSQSLLIHVPSSYLPIIDTLLPNHMVPVSLPPIEDAAPWKAVPQPYVDYLANITKHLEFVPEMDRVLNDGIEWDAIRRNVRWLTGEAPSGIVSRHSFTDGCLKAAEWIKGERVPPQKGLT